MYFTTALSFCRLLPFLGPSSIGAYLFPATIFHVITPPHRSIMPPPLILRRVYARRYYCYQENYHAAPYCYDLFTPRCCMPHADAFTSLRRQAHMRAIDELGLLISPTVGHCHYLLFLTRSLMPYRHNTFRFSLIIIIVTSHYHITMPAPSATLR